PHTAKFLGSTAERIVRRSPVPVLVATHPRNAPPRTLVVPVDDASITDKLLLCARDLAAAFNADVTLLHVLSNAVYSHVASMSYATAGGEESARREIRAALESEAARWLEALAGTGANRDRVSAVVAHGDAGDATLEMATAANADLIVLGRRGSGLVAPALLGSTVGTVLHGARCPVLVITEESDRPSG
ncbi:MAG: universal stress protein, partial [bacterium]